MRRRLGAHLALALALAIGAACSDDPGADPSPTTTERDSSTTAPTTTEAVDRDLEIAAVLAAYEESWRVFDDFLNGDAPGEPADYFAGDQLAVVVARIAEYAEGGYELRGEARLSPGAVALHGSSATFTDCQLDQTSQVVARTGEVVTPPSTRPQEVYVEMERSDDHWKVASVVFAAEGTCVR